MKRWQQLALIALGLGVAMMLVALMLVDFDFRKLDVTEAVQSHARTASYPVARTAGQSASEAEIVRVIDGIGGMQDVNVRIVDGTEITLEYTDSDLMHWEIERTGDGTLKMTLHSEMKWYDYLGMHFPDAHSLTIGLPSDAVLDALRLSTTSGDIDAPRLPRIAELALSSTSGVIRCGGEAESETIGAVSLASTSGNWQLRNLSVAGAVSVGTTSGSGDVRAVSAESLVLKSTSGCMALEDIDVRGDVIAGSTSGNISVKRMNVDGSVQLKSTSGCVDVEQCAAKRWSASSLSGVQLLTNVKIVDEIRLSTTSGNVQLRGVSAGQIDIGTTSGSVVAELPESAAAYGICTETTSGDAHVPDGANGDCPVFIRTTSGSIHVTCGENSK